MVAEGTFREDLFYRLNIIPIHLPPLRERKEDIPLLVQHFLKKFSVPSRSASAPKLAPSPSAGEPDGRSLSISQQAMRCLMAYSWPGNVRQLENAIERAVALSGGRTQIETADLTPDIQQASHAAAAPEVNLPEGGIDFDRYINESSTISSAARSRRPAETKGRRRSC